jgi:predicted acylesterase/phospholipase RssA
MRRWSTRFGVEFLGRNVDEFRMAWALREILKGQSLLNTDILINFLDELFKTAAPKAPTQLQDINSASGGIKLAITGSDLSRGQGETFEQGNLLDRIVSSCAIPFAFRTYTDLKTSPYVDGGICENLPVERLLKDEDSDGQVFAVSITEENSQPYIPPGAKEYGLQLISASMNHNVERAKKLVGRSNIIEATTELETFDFEGAIGKLRDESLYRINYEDALNKMVHYAQLHSDMETLSPSNLSGRVSAPKVMRSLYKVFEGTLRRPQWAYKKAVFMVRADCLRAPVYGKHRLADRVTAIAKVEASGSNLTLGARV